MLLHIAWVLACVRACVCRCKLSLLFTACPPLFPQKWRLLFSFLVCVCVACLTILFPPCLVCLVVQVAGGPKIPLRYGRKDAPDENSCARDGLLPGRASLLLAAQGEHHRISDYCMPKLENKSLRLLHMVVLQCVKCNACIPVILPAQCLATPWCHWFGDDTLHQSFSNCQSQRAAPLRSLHGTQRSASL
jgi:hypothetical protein